MSLPDPSTPAVRRRLPRKRWLLALPLILVAVLFYPPVFRFVAVRVILWEAGRQQVELKIGSVEGGPMDGLDFLKTEVRFSPPAGVDSVLQIGRVHADFSWKTLVLRKGHGWIRRLVLEDTEGVVKIVREEESDDVRVEGRHAGESRPWLEPVTIEAVRMNLVLRAGTESIQLRNAAFGAAAGLEGRIVFEEIALNLRTLRKRFRHVEGSAFLEGPTLTTWSMPLDSVVELNFLRLNFGNVLRGALRVDFDLRAFGGTIRGDAVSEARKGELNIEVNGWLADLQIAALADFMDFPGVAGGTVKEGKLGFRGSPAAWERSTVSLRIDAHDFRWGNKQWDSLVAGATLVNRRLQIPSLELQQAKNKLTLKGELLLPTSRETWWQSEFAFDLAAQIDDLNALSALFGPGFGEAFGKLSIDGSVRGTKQQFSGQIIASGSKLSWRNAPLDSLAAAIKLNGNEFQITTLEFSHKDDFLRAKGFANIVGERQYAGEIKASIKDLGLYDSILRPPLVPRSFRGGLSLDWSGDGTAKAHSGAFRGAFNKLGTLEKDGKLQPLDGFVEGTYAPGNVFLSRLTLAQSGNEWTSKVAVGPDWIHLQDIRFEQGTKTTLSGEALLPINVWNSWPYPQMVADGEARVEIEAKDLLLREVLQVAAVEVSGRATTSFKLSGSGKLLDLPLQGSLSWKDALIDLGALGTVQGDVHASVKGAMGQAAIAGSMEVGDWMMKTPLSLSQLVLERFPGVAKRSVPLVGDWLVDVVLSIPKAMRLKQGGTVQGQLTLGGSIDQITSVGGVTWRDVPLAEGLHPLRLEQGNMFIPADGEPVLDGRVSGKDDVSAFDLYFYGAETPRQTMIFSEPVRDTDALKVELLNGG